MVNKKGYIPLNNVYLIKPRSHIKFVKKLSSMALAIIGIFVLFQVLITRKRIKLVNEIEEHSTEKIEEDDLPVIVWWTGEMSATSKGEIHCKRKNVKCNVRPRNNFHENPRGAFLFYGDRVDFGDMPTSKRVDNFIWGLYHNKGPLSEPLFVQPATLRLFNFSATFSRYSNTPFPLQHLKKKDDITTKSFYKEVSLKNSLLQILSPVLYIQSDCTTMTERDEYVKELMKYIPVDSYGDCLRNRRLPDVLTRKRMTDTEEDILLNFTSQYKFVIAIEDAQCEDYISETLWRAIKTGTVPIYFGSPSVRDWLPNEKSAILIKDFPAPDLLSDHLEMLLNDDKLYEEYLEHKTKQQITNPKIHNALEFNSHQSNFVDMVQKFECLICDILHGKKSNLEVINEVQPNHYFCPLPVTALSLIVDVESKWMKIYQENMKKSEHLVPGRSHEYKCTIEPCPKTF